jgi:predicted DNA-binding transcriptional regulator AlpA
VRGVDLTVSVARMGAALSQNRPVPRRGLSRDEAAIYVGIGATLFDRLVSDGQMPKPFRIGSRILWDIRKIDLCIDELSHQDTGKSSWEDA